MLLTRNLWGNKEKHSKKDTKSKTVFEASSDGSYEIVSNLIKNYWQKACRFHPIRRLQSP